MSQVWMEGALTCRSGLCGSISFTTCPCCTRITWESPSQATCRVFPAMSAHTPVVPLCSRCEEKAKRVRASQAPAPQTPAVQTEGLPGQCWDSARPAPRGLLRQTGTV